MKYISQSEHRTKKIAQDLAGNLKSNIIALTGGLGAGKTTFTKGFAKGLGIEDKIISPTFVLIRQHRIPNSKGIFYHIDLYRLDEKISVQELGLEEFWSNPENIVLIEWADKIKDQLPKNIARISLKKVNNYQRIITIS